jgi:hypothetical protein
MRDRMVVTGAVRDAAAAQVTVTARSGLSQSGKGNSSAHRALPNHAHGALPLHQEITEAADARLRTHAMRDNFRLRTVSYLNAQKARARTSAQQT